MDQARPPAVAGTFYPSDGPTLRAAVERYLNDSAPVAETRPPPKAIIVPHAGYVYSGPVAARAFARLVPRRGAIERVVLIGPAHRLYVDGMALPKSTHFETPLGRVPVDQDAVASITDLPGVQVNEAAHRHEHSLEVQLPFLQAVLGSFSLVPLAVGQATPAAVAAVLERLWGGDETLIVISSDLSHYHAYATARAIDLATAEAVEARDGASLDGSRACGYLGIAGLLRVCVARGLPVVRLDLRNSGDTAGSRDEVVGYGAWAVPA